MKKIEDISKRALKTFIQGFIGSLAVIIPTTDFNNTAVLKSALIGCLAGGLSALMNFINNLLSEEK